MHILQLFSPYLRRFDFGLVKNKSALDQIERFDLYVSHALAEQNSYAQLMKENGNRLKKLLIVISKNDVRAFPAANKEFFIQLDVQEKKLLELNRSGHMAIIDFEKEMLFNEIYQFIKAS